MAAALPDPGWPRGNCPILLLATTVHRSFHHHRLLPGLRPSSTQRKDFLGIGVWNSGYISTSITRPHITIQGSGIAGYNSTFTAMSGGTIVQGQRPASTGADYFTV